MVGCMGVWGYGGMGVFVGVIWVLYLWSLIYFCCCCCFVLFCFFEICFVGWWCIWLYIWSIYGVYGYVYEVYGCIYGVYGYVCFPHASRGLLLASFGLALMRNVIEIVSSYFQF